MCCEQTLTAFTARRHASVVCAVIACPSVRLSQTGIVSKRVDESSCFLAWRFPPTHPTLCPCYEEIWVSPKIKVLSKFHHGKSIALSTKLIVVVDGRVCWRHLYDNRRVVAVYYKSINCNPLTPLLRYAVDLLYDFFLQLTRFWLT